MIRPFSIAVMVRESRPVRSASWVCVRPRFCRNSRMISPIGIKDSVDIVSLSSQASDQKFPCIWLNDKRPIPNDKGIEEMTS